MYGNKQSVTVLLIVL